MIKSIKKMLYVVTASLMMAAPLNAAGNNNELICIDPGHQVRGNSGLEEIAPGLSTRKPKVSSGTRGVATKKYEYQLTLEVGLKLRDALKNKGYKVFMVRETNDYSDRKSVV